MEKLIKIQSDLKAPKNQRNNFGKYNYRSCEDILEALKPLLKRHKCILTITDEIKEVGSIVFVEAKATIEDGEFSKTVTAQAGIDPNRKGMDISQSFGSSSSYARKYALNGLFLIDDNKDSDPADNTQKNTLAIPTEILNEITKDLAKVTNKEELKTLYNANSNHLKSYPTIKGMFTNKKMALNGN